MTVAFLDPTDRYAMDREKVEADTAWGRRVEEIVGGGAAAAVVPFPLQEKAS